MKLSLSPSILYLHQASARLLAHHLWATGRVWTLCRQQPISDGITCSWTVKPGTAIGLRCPIPHPDGNDVAGAVHHGQPHVHQHLPHELDIALVLAPERLPLGALERAHGLQRPRQQHGGQRGGENEPGRVRAHRVDQRAGARDVASHTAKRFAWRGGKKKKKWLILSAYWNDLKYWRFSLEEWVILTTCIM